MTKATKYMNKSIKAHLSEKWLQSFVLLSSFHEPSLYPRISVGVACISHDVELSLRPSLSWQKRKSIIIVIVTQKVYKNY